MTGRRPPWLSDVRAVTFDLDDTFWDCAPAIRHAERVLDDWLAAHAPAVLARHRAGDTLRHRERLLEQEPALAGDVSELRKRSLAALFRDADAAHAMSEAAFERFYEARSDVELYDGVRDLLAALPARYRVAAITNGNADLGRIGIADRFELVLVATLDSPAKPDRFMFDAACDRFDVAGQALLHVGDNAVTDVGGAMAAGCRACWFNQGGQPWSGPGPAPDMEVASIGELHALLLDD